MLKITSFLLKNYNITKCWELYPQTPYASGAWGLRHQTPTLPLSC